MNVSDLPDPIKLTEPVLRPSLDGDLTAWDVARLGLWHYKTGAAVLRFIDATRRSYSVLDTVGDAVKMMEAMIDQHQMNDIVNSNPDLIPIVVVLGSRDFVLRFGGISNVVRPVGVPLHGHRIEPRHVIVQPGWIATPVESQWITDTLMLRFGPPDNAGTMRRKLGKLEVHLS